MRISDLKENDVIRCDWFVDDCLLDCRIFVCKTQNGVAGLRLIPKRLVHNFSEKTDIGERKIVGASISILEKIHWNLIGSFNPDDDTYSWKKFQVWLIRTETGDVWKRDHPTQTYDCLEEAEKVARYWDNFYPFDFKMKTDGMGGTEKVYRETHVNVWKAQIVSI